MRRIITTLVAFALLTSCATWTQVGGNAAHTGEGLSTIDAHAASTLRRIWSQPVPTADGQYLEPISDGTRVFLVERTPSCALCPDSPVGSVVALDLATGARRWTTSEAVTTVGRNLAVSDGLVVAIGGTCINAYDTATGTRRWQHCERVAPIGPPTVADGLVEIPFSSTVLQLRLSDGTETTAEIGNYYSDPFIDVADGMVLAGGEVFDEKTGAFVWNLVLPGAHAIRDGILYSADLDGLMTAYVFATGRELWTINTNCLGTSALALDASTIYLQDCNQARALDRATGRERWHADDTQINGGNDRPILANGLLYFTNESTAMYILRASNGQLVRTILLESNPGAASGTGPPVVVGDRVIVAGSYGIDVYAPA